MRAFTRILLQCGEGTRERRSRLERDSKGARRDRAWATRDHHDKSSRGKHPFNLLAYRRNVVVRTYLLYTTYDTRLRAAYNARNIMGMLPSWWGFPSPFSPPGEPAPPFRGEPRRPPHRVPLFTIARSP